MANTSPLIAAVTTVAESQDNQTNSKPLTVMLPPNLHKRAKVMAYLRGMSLSAIVRDFLKAEVEAELTALLQDGLEEK